MRYVKHKVKQLEFNKLNVNEIDVNRIGVGLNWIKAERFGIESV
jgi:hypothetical protein